MRHGKTKLTMKVGKIDLGSHFYANGVTSNCNTCRLLHFKYIDQIIDYLSFVFN